MLLNGLQQAGLDFDDFDDIYALVSWIRVLGLGVEEWWIWYSTVLFGDGCVSRSGGVRWSGKDGIEPVVPLRRVD